MEGRTLPGATELVTLHLRRTARVVPVPGGGLRAARGGSVRWCHLRLPTLLPTGLSQPAGNRRRSSPTPGGQNPRTPGLGAGHPERRRQQAEMDALAHLPALEHQT